MTPKEEFKDIVFKNISRSGIEAFMDHLENETDFFVSPASTKYHGSYEGGLLEHSLNVYYMLIQELKFMYGNDWERRYSMESVAIVSLFHDVCKCGRYKKTIKYQKNKETGAWEDKETYEYDSDYLLMGHAALSIHRIEQFMTLWDYEAQAIYWHMGAFDLSQYSSSLNLSEAFNRNPLAYALHKADMDATHICENPHFIPVGEEQD